MRMPDARATAVSASCRRRPSPPVSAKPALKTTTAFTPALAQASAVSTTAGAGTAMTAVSTGSGTSAMVGNAGRPWIVARRGFTGKMGPANPASRVYASGRPPMRAGSPEAPMIAIERGWRRAVRESSGAGGRIGGHVARLYPSKGRRPAGGAGATITRPPIATMPTATVRVLNYHPAAVWVEQLRGAGCVVDVRPLRTPADLKAIGEDPGRVCCSPVGRHDGADPSRTGRASCSRPEAGPPTGERLDWRLPR